MTHLDYFKKYRISIEQYGEILIATAYDGEKSPHGNRKGFDIDKANVNGKSCRIEVKSKTCKNAQVVKCNDFKFPVAEEEGMTHLAVILVEPDSGVIVEAWLITRNQAEKLRNHRQHFNMSELHKFDSKENICKKLNDVTKSEL